MKISSTLVAISLLGCSDIAVSTNQVPECRFEFHKLSSCVQDDYTVSIQSKPMAADEIQLQSLQVSYHGRQQWLKITEKTIMLEGDKGIISFEDINFDGVADIAISTSFGLANLYMDYWVFDKQKKHFIKIGNYPRFVLNPANKSLNNSIRLDAANYQQRVYTWQASKLVESKTGSGK